MSVDLAHTAQWSVANKEAARFELDKCDAEDSLYSFIKLMWSVLEPGTKFIYTDVGFIVLAWVVEKMNTGPNCVTKRNPSNRPASMPSGKMVE